MRSPAESLTRIVYWTATNTTGDIVTEEGIDRISAMEGQTLDPGSLVGSYFHAGVERGWQGCVVAEPAPGVYLVELFSWGVGGSTNQHLIAIETMVTEGWQFYDNAEWMRNAYEYGGLHERWEREREQRSVNDSHQEER
jgi:hypothetical protein